MTNFREDEMLIFLINGDVAQLEERHNGIVEVVSSRLIVSSFYCFIYFILNSRGIILYWV